MSKGFRSTTGNAIGNYVGETSKQIRNGFGVYNYSNKFSVMEENGGKERNMEKVSLLKQNGDIYKGSFYQHKKHGKGHQIYSNGDEYEGDWVQGLKQGLGRIKYSDGTIYKGQWRNNMFNGEGSIFHVPGVDYFEAESYPLTEMLPDNEPFVNGKIEEVALTIETEDKNVEIVQRFCYYS
ncbi:MORN repeat-containing protein 1-like [Xenia sp. Carnegie-2017]|uniref:MORN repeat-containing protein 1-like n=1 Tax=Xenia sp. Carnegie-2017 TaxID=2897299 RepID=UPI001F04BC9C|nr:MORN repeat-containing protein 1-like [Xenia sp. Carnegie-2017]